MQILFAMNRDSEFTDEKALKTYEQNVVNSYILYLFNLYCLIQICKFARKDADKRQSKYLTSEEDRNFSAKLVENHLVQSLINNRDLQKLFKKYHFESRVDLDLIRKLYKLFAKEQSYQDYVYRASTSDEDHNLILHELYRMVRKNEVFNEIMEDLYLTWEDDKSLVIGAVKKTLKILPAQEKFLEQFEVPDDTRQFGVQLLNRTSKEGEKFMSIFRPNLKNWDIDRLAILDMIFLKMAICEFLNFKTIPTKVTLNEYVELAKIYSTAKSKDFINGILDKVMKELNEEGLIKKEGRGLFD